MRYALATVLALGLLSGAGVARDKRDPLAKALEGRVAGNPVECVDPSRLSGPQIIDNQTILYRDGPRLWRTGPTGACPALRPVTTLITEIYGGQLCRRDRFRVAAPGDVIASNTCFFTAFTPYDKPASH